MKKIGLFLLAIVTMAGIAGCGGQDDIAIESFDMNGNWQMVYTVVGNVATSCGATDERVGRTGSAAVTITENGAVVTVNVAGTLINFGADVPLTAYVGPATAKEFKVTAARGSVASLVMFGSKQGGDSMAGVIKAACNGVTYDEALIAFSLNK